MGNILNFYEGVEVFPAQHPAILTDSHWFVVSRVSKAKD